MHGRLPAMVTRIRETITALGGEVRFESPVTNLVVGTEGRGLDDQMRAHADALVRIPMREGVESLNVAVAGSLVLYKLAGLLC